MKWKTAFRALALGLLSLSSLSAFAYGEIGSNWLNVIQSLEKRGITQVGSFNVASFKRKAAGIRWAAMDSAPPAIVAGARQSAVYYKQKKMIFVNEGLFAFDNKSSLPQLELHELLGVTGYDDSNYQSSLALLEISLAPSRAEAERLRDVYAASIFNSQEIMARNAPEDVPSAFRPGGSGTSIGGGGDLTAIAVKAAVLKYIKAQGGVTNEFLATYPNIGFEPQNTPGSPISVEYQYFSQKRSKKGYRETFAVWVPMDRYRQGPGEQRRLVAEIAAKITALFPTRSGQAVVVTPPGCPNSVTLNFPYTNDPRIAHLQQERAVAIGRCYGDAITYQSTVLDAPRAGAEPKRGGIFNFTCLWEHRSIGSQPYPVRTTSILGRSESKSLGIGWTGADYLDGSFSVDARGSLTGISINFKPTGGQMIRSPRARAQSETYAVTEIQVDGSPLRFSCQREQ